MRLIDADAFEVVTLQGKSEEFCNGVQWVLEQIDKQPTIDAIIVTEMNKHKSNFDFEDYDSRPDCCKEHGKYFSTCDTCEFGDDEE